MEKYYYTKDQGLFTEIHFLAYYDDQGAPQWGLRIARSDSQLKREIRSLERNGWKRKEK